MFIEASVSPAEASRSASRGLIGHRPPNIGNRILTPACPLGFTSVQERSLRYANMQETGVPADLERMRIGVDNPEQE
jgi:hypothetical protein